MVGYAGSWGAVVDGHSVCTIPGVQFLHQVVDVAPERPCRVGLLQFFHYIYGPQKCKGGIPVSRALLLQPLQCIYIYAVKFAKMQKWDFSSCRRVAGHGLGTTFATPAMDI